jgi:putative toxin-antitoxin system antitoxin component (TIGR02293 family)
MDYAGIITLLGGREVITEEIRTPLDTHRVIRQGLPRQSVITLLQSLSANHDPVVVANAMGMSVRTTQRLKKALPDEPISPEQSDRVWQFAEVLTQATAVFGTLEDAEQWLETAAPALDGAKPIDLLSSQPGVEMVQTLLSRIEHGVYT